MDDLTIKARLLNGVSKPAAEAQKSVEALARATAKASTGNILGKTHLDTFKSKLDSVHGLFQRIGRSVSDLGSKIMSNIGSKARSAFDSAANAASRLGKVLAGGLIAGAAFGIRAYAQIEQQQVAFETLLGSQDKAARLIKQMKSFANVTPFRFGDVADSAKLLLAGGWKQDAIIPTLTKIGDAASAVSVPIDRVLMQLTQMQASKAMNWVDMRVLSQTGLPVLDILGKKLGKTGDQIREIMSNSGGGKWLAQQGGIQKLIDGLGERYKGMMAKQSTTLAGLWSTMKDTFSNNLGDAMAPLANGIIKPFLTKLIPQVESKLKSFAALSTSIIDGWTGKGKTLAGMQGEAPRNGLPRRKGILGVGANLDELFHTNKFTKMAIKLKTIFGWLGKHKSVFTSLAIAIGLVTAGFILLSLAAYLPIVAVIALATWLVNLYRHSKKFRDIVDKIGRIGKKAFGMIVTGAIAVAGFIRRAWNATAGFRSALARIAPKAIHAVGTAFLAAWRFAKKLWNSTAGIREAIARIAPKVIDAVGSALHTAWGWAKKAWGALKTVVEWIGKVSSGPVDALVGAFGSVVGAIKSAIGFVGDLIGALGKIPAAMGAVSGVVTGTGPIGGALKQAGKSGGSLGLFAKVARVATRAVAPIGDISAPRIRVRGYQTHGRAPLQRALSIGQGIKVSSGFRTHSLGSFNSAHKAGNGFDLVGSGLNSYAARLNDSGGFAQFHGNGSARHLHTEHPLGDMNAPRVTASRSGGSTVVNNAYSFTVNGSGLTAQELKQTFHQFANERERARSERGPGRR